MSVQEQNLPQVVNSDVSTQPQSVFLNINAFANGQRMAELLSRSKLIPESFRGNLPDCVIALELAQRIGCSPLAVMQNTYIVHGRPGYSAQFIIALVNACGKFSPLRFDISGDGDDRQCIAWAVEKETGDRLESSPVSIKMAKAEGWYSKNGSKWQTMPEQMLRYRAATFFGRIYAPELLQGMRTVEELRDEDHAPVVEAPRHEPKKVSKLAEKFSKQDSVTVQQDPQISEPQSSDEPPVASVDQDLVDKCTKEINRCKSTIALDKWRLSNIERIAGQTNEATLLAIQNLADDVYGFLKHEEEQEEKLS